MVRKLGGLACVVGVLVFGGATLAPALAALPPYWQSAREISTIVNDPRVHDALKYEEPILSVTTTGDDVYELRTARCTLTVTIVDLPPKEGMVGPQAFDIQLGEAECQ
jgi:hypothetical protein